MDTWEWDPSLYSGSAAYCPRGRIAYPSALAEALATELVLDGSGRRLLDVGCGPGSLTLLLADRFEQAIGLDADRDMLDVGGAVAHVSATTHEGVDGEEALPHPRPPHPSIAQLVHTYLGPVRRAGQGSLPHGTAAGEPDIYRAAGFTSRAADRGTGPGGHARSRRRRRVGLLAVQLGATPVRR